MGKRSRFSFLRSLSLLALTLAPLLNLALAQADDLTVYTDNSLASGWENWSWNTQVDFGATDIFEGQSSISVTSDAWAALSFKLGSTNFGEFEGLRFDIAGNQPEIQIYFESTTAGVSSPAIPLTALSRSIASDKFTSLLIDFSSLPGTGTPLGEGTWDRISFQAQGNGASYHLDNIVVVRSIVVTPEFLGAEPLANNLIALTTVGDVDFSKVSVSLGGQKLSVSSRNTYVPSDTPAKSITYLTLGSALKPGSLVISDGGAKNWTYTLPNPSYASIVTSVARPINPHIYGVNWPTSANYIRNLGVTLSRWGGNAVTAYNPFGHYTNAGNDWYFENRDAENADDWIGWVGAAGSDTIMTVPALDWVSKDNYSYSYPRTIYPEQERFDPYNPDAGNGRFPNGTALSPPTDPRNAYTTWNTTAAKTWLSNLAHKPKIVNIDNEIEIAHSTHQDMHPEPVSYDEELSRVIQFATVAKEAIPNVLVAAPSTCSWWFYWTSAVGWSDTAAHDNIDFLPWFLAEMRKHHEKTGKRLLDYLDIHYYFQADTSANDAAAKALRLRATRGWWDPSYDDESWIGQDPQHHQWNPRSVNLIPRFKTLIDINYPGTKLAVGEWAATGETDITGGLVTADSLGLFGRYGLDYATYWATPNEQGPVGLAYWLFRGYGTYFGDQSVQVNFAQSDAANTYGIYASKGKNASGKEVVSVVIVNKDPAKPLSLDLANLPTGKYFLRHFGGASGTAKWQTNITISSSTYIVVPPYVAAFLQQQ
ncbi:hypothetical protein AX16_005761 [Volvariella volvacea WC 439]|nr:hypothetical protein AX16_005761 [Volvariella volvacea WC 439]